MQGRINAAKVFSTIFRSALGADMKHQQPAVKLYKDPRASY